MDFITGLPERNVNNALIVCCDKLGKLTRLVPTWVGENHLAAPEVAKMFLQIGYGTMEYLSGWCMIVMCILLHHSGVPCGPCSERKLYLVVLITRRPMVKWNVRTVPLSKLFVL